MKIKCYLHALFFIFMLAACSPVTQTQEPKPESSATYTPTPGKSPTATTQPSAMPLPTLEELGTLGQGILPDILYSPDGKTIFVNDGETLKTLNTADFSEVDSVDLSLDEYESLESISPDGKLMIISGFLGFRVIEISSGRELAQSSGGNGGTAGPVFSPDQKYVVYLDTDHTTGGPYYAICQNEIKGPTLQPEEQSNCYPLAAGADYERYHTLTLPAVSPDGKWVAAGYEDLTRKSLYIWGLESKKILHQITELPGEVIAVAFSPDSATLASAGEDGILRLWDVKTGKLSRSIPAFTDNLTGVSFSEDGRKLIVDVYKQPTQVYDLDSGKTVPFSTLPESISPLTQKMLGEGYLLNGQGSKIRFSPDGKTVAVGHGSIQVWDVASRKLINALSADGVLGIGGMVYSPDGKHLALVTNSGDIYAWEIGSGRQEFYVSATALSNAQVYYAAGAGGLGPGIGTGVFGESGLAFSPDATRLAIANGAAVELWNIQSVSKIRELAPTKPVMYPSKIAFSADGKQVYASLNRNQDLAVWDAESGALLRQLKLPQVDPNAFSATELQGKLFARNNYKDDDYWIELWNIETGQMTKIVTGTREMEPLRISPDGKFLAAMLQKDDQPLYIWRADTGQLVFISEAGSDTGDFAIGPDGALLATASYGKATLWDASQHTAKAFQPDFTALALPPTPTPWGGGSNSEPYPTFTPQPTRVVAALPLPMESAGAIQAQNAAQVKELKRFGRGQVIQATWGSDETSALVTTSVGVYSMNMGNLQAATLFDREGFSVLASQPLPDGRLLTAGLTQEKKLQAWDTSNNTLLVELPESYTAAFSPDGRWLVYATEKGLETIHLENKTPGMTLLTLSSKGPSLAVFSPDGRHLAAVFGRFLRIWDMETGIIVNAAGGPEVRIDSLAFSPDGKNLLGAAGGDAWVWSMSPSVPPLKLHLFDRQVKRNITWFNESVTAVAASPANSVIAVGTTRRDILLYSRKTGALLGSLIGQSSAPGEIRFNKDGSRLLAIGADGDVALWDVAAQKALAHSHEFSGPVNGIVSRSDGQVSAWLNNTIWTFNPLQLEARQPAYIPAKTILAVSPAGNLAAGYTPLQVSIYNAEDGMLQQTLSEEPPSDFFIEYRWEGQVIQQFYGAIFSPDGNHLATYGAGGLWMYEGPDWEMVSYSQGTFTEKAAFSPDGKTLVYALYEQVHPPIVFPFGHGDFEDGYYLSNHYDSVAKQYSKYAFSPDGQKVALLHMYQWSNESVPTLELADISSARITETLPFAKDEIPTCLAYNPTGSLLAVGFQDGRFFIIDMQALKVVAGVQAYDDMVTAITFSQDGRQLITGGADGMVKTWGLP